MVSVIMPAYNASKTIHEAIESVIGQTYSDWELIVINDCSKDDTLDILKTYAKDDARIKIINNDVNSGVSISRNRGVQAAAGEYIAFLDSDDMWRNDKLQKQTDLMNRKKAVISYTASSFINEVGQTYGYVMPAENRTNLDTLLKKNLLSCSSVMIRASIMKKIKMPGDEMHEDYYVWIKVLRKFKYAYGINEPLLIYRMSSNSKSSGRIRSARMIYNTYRAVGYDRMISLYFMLRYTWHSVSKRFLIKHGEDYYINKFRSLMK